MSLLALQQHYLHCIELFHSAIQMFHRTKGVTCFSIHIYLMLECGHVHLPLNSSEQRGVRSFLLNATDVTLRLTLLLPVFILLFQGPHFVL